MASSAKKLRFCELFDLCSGDMETVRLSKTLKNEQFLRGSALRLRDLKQKTSHFRKNLANRTLFSAENIKK